MRVSPSAAIVCRILRESGHEAWLVGGAVRDSLLGWPPHDWDVATDAHPVTVQGLFSRVLLTGEQHGTVTVLLDDEPFEVTTFRRDGKYSDGRRPDDVRFADTIEEDLARRDFTINALAYNPIDGRLLDLFGGVDDLKQGVLRAVGNARERFAEDGLRVLRAARFCATQELSMAPETFAAMTGALDVFAKVAAERVHAEWMKILKDARNPSRAFRVMLASGLLGVTAPEMLPMYACHQNRYHAYDVWEHTLHVLDACPMADPVLRLAALFHDVSKPETRAFSEKTGDVTFYDHENVGAVKSDEILRRMCFSNEQRERAVHLVRHHLVRYDANWSNATVRRWVRRVGAEHVSALCELARADVVGKGPAKAAMDLELTNELARRVSSMPPIVTHETALAITGNDVMRELGIEPGPEVGRALRRLLELVTEDPECNSRDRLLAELRVETTS